MRFTKIFPLTLLVLSGMLLPSCLKDQEEIFDTPSSLRMQEYLDNAKATLTSSQQGWIFDYYPDRDLSYGGFVYTVKFDESNVTVGCELDPGKFETSLYKLTDDNGPILSFDSYNSLMHYFSTPSSGQYQAFDGDFEFRIMDVTDDLITLKGNRTGNTMYLHRMQENADEYINSVVDLADNMVVAVAADVVDGKMYMVNNMSSVRHLAISMFDLQKMLDVLGDDAANLETFMDFDVLETYLEQKGYTLEEFGLETEMQPYVMTKTGGTLYEPINIGGYDFESFDYDVATTTYTLKSSDKTVAIKGEIPPTYAYFNELEGEFILVYNAGRKSVNVTLVPDKANNCYLMKGLNPNFDVVVEYEKTYGAFGISSQKVATDGSLSIWLCGWNAASGNLSWSTECGMLLMKNPDKPGQFDFIPTGASINADSFIMWSLNGTSSAGAAQSQWFVNGSGQMPYFVSLVKK